MILPPFYFKAQSLLCYNHRGYLTTTGFLMTHQVSRGRQPSHDELKAAEAAFEGRPFNEAWSRAARDVYDGIMAATLKVKGRSEKEGLRELPHELDETKVPVGAMACTGDEE